MSSAAKKIETSDTDGGEGAEGAETGGEQRQEQRVDAPDADTEDRARRMGWRPKDEFEASGRDASKWVSAEEFIEAGERSLPILRERMRKVDKALEESTKLMRDLVKHQAKTTQQAIDRAIADFQAEKRIAVTEGDADRVEALDKKIDAKKAEKDEIPTASETKADPVPEVFVKWGESNPWFFKDQELREEAEDQLDILNASRRTKALSEAEKLRLVTQHVKGKFPAKFGNQRRQEPSSVEGGTQSRGKPGGKTWNDLPADVRGIAERLVATKVVASREAYLKSYQWD